MMQVSESLWHAMIIRDCCFKTFFHPKLVMNESYSSKIRVETMLTTPSSLTYTKGEAANTLDGWCLLIELKLYSTIETFFLQYEFIYCLCVE